MKLQVYCPETNGWEPGVAMLTPRFKAAVAVLGGCLYCKLFDEVDTKLFEHHIKKALVGMGTDIEYAINKWAKGTKLKRYDPFH